MTFAKFVSISSSKRKSSSVIPTCSTSSIDSAAMTSLKRSLASDPYAPNISSKVFVRSTKSGKVQKIVRELYLRQDIPCSSKLCTICLPGAPRDASGFRESSISLVHLSEPIKKLILQPSCAFCVVRKAGRYQSFPPGSLPCP
jgi:hypothetical protein